MKVSFYATLRAIVGQKTIQVDLKPQATARDLVESCRHRLSTHARQNCLTPTTSSRVT